MVANNTSKPGSASTSQSKARLSYSARIPYQNNAAAVKLLELMERKKTNLCVSVDVTKGEDMLEVVRRVGKSCCMIKASLVPLL
jgi:orotidine-5'-phosphate decarboxylase